MAITFTYLDASIKSFEKSINYRNIGFSENGVVYTIRSSDDLTQDMPNVAVVFSLIFADYETKKNEYVDVCENFYERAEEFSAAKANLEVQKKRLDFVVKIIQGRAEIFEEMYGNEEVFTQYITYLQGDHLKSISDFFPLDKALQQQKDQKDFYENKIRELEQGRDKKRLSILVHNSSSSSLPSPTMGSSVAVISNPLESIADSIAFVSSNCTQYDEEFGVNGKAACGAIAFQSLSQLFKNPDMTQINEVWIHDAIKDGVKVYDRVVEAMRGAVLGAGISVDNAVKSSAIDASIIGNYFPDLSMEKLSFKDTAAKGAHHFVGKNTLHQALLQLEDLAKTSSSNSAGAVISCNGKSYAVKIDFNPNSSASVATLIDSHSYPFDEYAKSSYACRFPDLNATSDYLNYLLRPHDDGSQRFSQFTIVAVTRK